MEHWNLYSISNTNTQLREYGHPSASSGQALHENSGGFGNRKIIMENFSGKRVFHEYETNTHTQNGLRWHSRAAVCNAGRKLPLCRCGNDNGDGTGVESAFGEGVVVEQDGASQSANVAFVYANNAFGGFGA